MSLSGRGRPSHVPTDAARKQVEALASFGVTQEDIARVVGIAPKTLRRHYREILATAEIRANSMVAQSLFKKATGDGPAAVTAAIFWMKTRARWKEFVVQEHSGVLTLESLVSESYRGPGPSNKP
jgi:DNA-binding XRE family transcriptional regulator